MCSADIFLGLLAILFPPLPVWIKCGICSADSVINILLCLLGYIPGLLHAWYIIAKFPEPGYEYEALGPDREAGGRVTYVYVQSPAGGGRCGRGARQQPRPHAAMDYGSTQPAAAGAPPHKPQQPQPQEQEHGVAGGSSGSNQRGVPPSYAEVVAGDHKIQTDE